MPTLADTIRTAHEETTIVMQTAAEQSRRVRNAECAANIQRKQSTLLSDIEQQFKLVNLNQLVEMMVDRSSPTVHAALRIPAEGYLHDDMGITAKELPAADDTSYHCQVHGVPPVGLPEFCQRIGATEAYQQLERQFAAEGLHIVLQYLPVSDREARIKYYEPYQAGQGYTDEIPRTLVLTISPTQISRPIQTGNKRELTAKDAVYKYDGDAAMFLKASAHAPEPVMSGTAQDFRANGEPHPELRQPQAPKYSWLRDALSKALGFRHQGPAQS